MKQLRVIQRHFPVLRKPVVNVSRGRFQVPGSSVIGFAVDTYLRLEVISEAPHVGKMYINQWIPNNMSGRRLIGRIYSGLFAIHLALHATKRETDSSKKPNIIFYALCVLYVLTVALFAIDIAADTLPSLDGIDVTYGIVIAASTIFGCCDFIAQCILIHRCWIVYSQNIRVIIVPSILALAYLVTWFAVNGALFIVQNEVDETGWGDRLFLASLVTSMSVNALVTGLIVFKIFKVFREVRSVTTSAEISLGITGGTKLRSVIFIIIESGMALFALQLARVVITATQLVTYTEFEAFEFIVVTHEMVNGIAPTIILVRVSLGLSFHDKESLGEAVGSLQFAVNPIPEAGSIDQDRSSDIGHDDDHNPLPVMGDINRVRRNDVEVTISRS